MLALKSNTQYACGCQLQRIGEDVSEKLDYTPGVFTVEQHVRALHSRETGARNHGSRFRQVGYAEADSGTASAVENVIRETEQNPAAAGASVGDADGVRCPESRRGLRVTNGRCQ